jgi:cytochrome c2
MKPIDRVARRPSAALAASGLALSIVAVFLGGCDNRNATDVGSGDPDRGSILVGRQACGACHEIPHVPQATGRVGPPLKGIARRTIIAGYLANTPDNLARWIQSPQTIAPGNAMPDMGLSDRDARDITAFLETLR